MQARKFWIVEYVDVNAPKVERSEICASRKEALRKAIKREAAIHFVNLESFAGAGFCETLRLSGAFDNELRA